MLLEARIPVSPRPAWLNRVRLIAASLREWYPDFRVLVSSYPYVTKEDLTVTKNLPVYYGGPSTDEFNAWAGTRSEYLATMMDRYKPPFYGDYILMLDADVIPIRPFPEWF